VRCQGARTRPGQQVEGLTAVLPGLLAQQGLQDTTLFLAVDGVALSVLRRLHGLNVVLQAANPFGDRGPRCVEGLGGNARQCTRVEGVGIQ
jgi:hypothetical protein